MTPTIALFDIDGTLVTCGGAGRRSMTRAFADLGAAQCGYCTPGMIMTVTAAIADNPNLDEKAAREAISGNICRCTGYETIVDAALDAAGQMRGA
jgi:aerobic-type carbon monoxide dehydrogenase small subunit (CoxS/CutS family)